MWRLYLAPQAGVSCYIHVDSFSLPHPPPAFRGLSKTLCSDPSGLIRLADDECLCPEGSGRSFVDKLLLVAAADHSMRRQQASDQTNEGSHAPNDHAETSGNDGNHGGGGRKNKACNRIPGMVRAGSEGGSSRGNSAGSDGGGWPVYADLAKADSRLAEQCVFQIRHFVGECDLDFHAPPLFRTLAELRVPSNSHPNISVDTRYSHKSLEKVMLGSNCRETSSEASAFFSSTSSTAA